MSEKKKDCLQDRHDRTRLVHKYWVTTRLSVAIARIIALMKLQFHEACEYKDKRLRPKGFTCKSKWVRLRRPYYVIPMYGKKDICLCRYHMQFENFAHAVYQWTRLIRTHHLVPGEPPMVVPENAMAFRRLLVCPVLDVEFRLALRRALALVSCGSAMRGDGNATRKLRRDLLVQPVFMRIMAFTVRAWQQEGDPGGWTTKNFRQPYDDIACMNEECEKCRGLRRLHNTSRSDDGIEGLVSPAEVSVNEHLTFDIWVKEDDDWDFRTKNLDFLQSRDHVLEWWKEFKVHHALSKWISRDKAWLRRHFGRGEVFVVFDFSENGKIDRLREYQSRYYKSYGFTLFPMVVTSHIEDRLDLTEEQKTRLISHCKQHGRPLLWTETHFIVSARHHARHGGSSTLLWQGLRPRHQEGGEGPQGGPRVLGRLCLAVLQQGHLPVDQQILAR